MNITPPLHRKAESSRPDALGENTHEGARVVTEHIDHEELAQDIFHSWGLAESELTIVRQAIEAEPERMQRIYRLAELLYSEDQRLLLPDARGIQDASVLDLLARGWLGVMAVEDTLAFTFYDAAPREIFALAGKPRDNALRVQVLRNMLTLRFLYPSALPAWGHPLVIGYQPIDRPDERLAAALTSALSDYDGQSARHLIVEATTDAAEVVRCAAVQAAAGFVGYRDIRAALGAMAQDESPAVAFLALETLARFIDRPDVGDAVFGFIAALDPTVQRRALQLVTGRS